MTLAQYSQQDLIHRAMCSHRSVYEKKAETILDNSEDVRKWNEYFGAADMMVEFEMPEHSVGAFLIHARPKVPVRVYRNYLVYFIEYLRAEIYLGNKNMESVLRKQLVRMDLVKDQAEKEDEDDEGRIESLHAADFERNAYGVD